MEDKDDQVMSLTFVKSLWDITNDVLGPLVKLLPTPLSSSPGSRSNTLIESPLSRIPLSLIDGLLDPVDLTIDIHTRPVVFDLWSELLADVLLNAPSKSLTRVCEDMVWDDDSSRELWRVLANRACQESGAVELEEYLALLAVPFR